MHTSDCAMKNIMMDSKPLYPRGFHPVYPHRLPDAMPEAPVLSRSAFPVRYYYVDFGISSYIPPEVEDKVVEGDLGRDQEVPELSRYIPYDPFKVDIFVLGNVFKKEFLQVLVSTL